jgi:hypothetical protein
MATAMLEPLLRRRKEEEAPRIAPRMDRSPADIRSPHTDVFNEVGLCLVCVSIPRD